MRWTVSVKTSVAAKWEPEKLARRTQRHLLTEPEYWWHETQIISCRVHMTFLGVENHIADFEGISE